MLKPTNGPTADGRNTSNRRRQLGLPVSKSETGIVILPPVVCSLESLVQSFADGFTFETGKHKKNAWSEWLKLIFTLQSDGPAM